MSLDNRYDPQLHRILFGGTVVHIQDIGNGEKIRALPEQERISEISVQNFIDGVCIFLIQLTEVFDPQEDSDLLNLRDEMLHGFNKLK